jgi:N-acetylglutamate synthase-like GNAT family acetyltransferase
LRKIKIASFRNKHQEDIDAMMLQISKEFDEVIFSPNSVPIKRVAHVIGNQFWVALDEKLVVGTLGIMRMNAHEADLKSFFVYKEYRGTEVAGLLLQQLMNYAQTKSIRMIYVGTMGQFKAAQRFYEKHGFLKIQEEDLPATFNRNPLDTVFYRMEL